MSEARNDGGPAFPVELLTGKSDGMSLRDYFAGQAIIGLVINSGRNNADDACVAYQVADAMLAARANGGTQP